MSAGAPRPGELGPGELGLTGRSIDDQGDDGAPRLPWCALATWPRAWRERYGDEIADSWQATGAGRRAALGIAVRGLREQLTRPAPAALAPAVLGPDWDRRPGWRRRGAIAAAAIVTIAVEYAVIVVADLAPTSSRVIELSILLTSLLPVLGLVLGLWIARRPGGRSMGQGVLAGSVVIGAVASQLLLVPLALVALVVWGLTHLPAARRGRRAPRFAVVAVGVYAVTVLAAAAFAIYAVAVDGEGGALGGIWVMMATAPLSMIVLPLASLVGLPGGWFGLVAMLLFCGGAQGAALWRLLGGRRDGRHDILRSADVRGASAEPPASEAPRP